MAKSGSLSINSENIFCKFRLNHLLKDSLAVIKELFVFQI